MEMYETLRHLFNRFQLDWKVLRAIMVTTGAMISGSAALAVLHTGKFVPQDLDIYVTSENFAAVLLFLQEQGYEVQMPEIGATKKVYGDSTVTLTLKNRGREKIDLVATTEPHVVHAITRFHSTCVMNFITYYSIVCLYPEIRMDDA